MRKKINTFIITAMMAAALTACGGTSGKVSDDSTSAKSEITAEVSEITTGEDKNSEAGDTAGKASDKATGEASSEAAGEASGETALINTSSNGAIDTTDLFSNRDLKQEADLTDATTYTVADGQDISITSAGVYVITGSASEVTITVDAGDEDKVQLVLDGVSITNTDSPCIYVKNADKTFVTTTGAESSLTVSGTFLTDGDTNTDAVIFAKDDLTVNGTGTLNISSTDNGITCKNDLKVTGGVINISCEGSALESKDSINVADGTINVTKCNDGIHAEDNDDDTKGYVYICGGEISITAADDGIHATTIAQIDGGTIDVTAAEGIEATEVQINDGTIKIAASDDGINAASKSSSMDIWVEINGGYTTINMGQGDTDGVDSNGSIYINGGTVDVTGQSPFDYDKAAEHNGGTIIVNGSETDEISNQFGGAMGGGRGGKGGMNGEEGFGGGFPGGGMNGEGEENFRQRPEGFDGELPEGFEKKFDENMNGERPEMPEGFDKGNFEEGGRGFKNHGGKGKEETTTETTTTESTTTKSTATEGAVDA